MFCTPQRRALHRVLSILYSLLAVLSLFLGLVCQHWHTQVSVSPIWDTILVPHFSSHISLLLFASPVNFFVSVYFLFVSLVIHVSMDNMHLTHVLSSLADHSLFALLQSPIHQSHFSCYSAQCKVTPKTPESGLRYNQLSRSC